VTRIRPARGRERARSHRCRRRRSATVSRRYLRSRGLSGTPDQSPRSNGALEEFARVSTDLVAAVEPDNAAVEIDSSVDAEGRLERRARRAYLEGVDTDVALGAGARDAFETAGSRCSKLAGTTTFERSNRRIATARADGGPPEGDRRWAGRRPGDHPLGAVTESEYDDLRSSWRRWANCRRADGAKGIVARKRSRFSSPSAGRLVRFRHGSRAVAMDALRSVSSGEKRSQPATDQSADEPVDGGQHREGEHDQNDARQSESREHRADRADRREYQQRRFVVQSEKRPENAVTVS